MLPRTPSRCRLSVLGAADWRVGSLQQQQLQEAAADAAAKWMKSWLPHSPAFPCLQSHRRAVLCSGPPCVCCVQVGEVWVRGPTVFAGYWGLPEATAESFAEGGWFK